MPRYKLTLEYFGPAFSGWQKTPGQPSVQATLEEAIFLFCGERVQTIAAGRTDSGVHALGQVVHFDLAKPHDPSTVMNALNYHLQEIAKKSYTHEGYMERVAAVVAAEIAADDFHARFSAKARHYAYRILNRCAAPVLDAPYVWHVPEPLDLACMQAAAHTLVGYHDFSSFRDAKCQAKSPLKSLDQLEVTQAGEEIHIYVSSRSFMHHQVRIMAGSLKCVGTGRWTPGHMKTVLEVRDRTQAGPTAPAQGLCFMRVDYSPRNNVAEFLDSTA